MNAQDHGQACMQIMLQTKKVNSFYYQDLRKSVEQNLTKFNI